MKKAEPNDDPYLEGGYGKRNAWRVPTREGGTPKNMIARREPIGSKPKNSKSGIKHGRTTHARSTGSKKDTFFEKQVNREKGGVGEGVGRQVSGLMGNSKDWRSQVTFQGSKKGTRVGH